MNRGLKALVILSPHIYRVVEQETDPNKHHSLVLPVRRSSRDLVREVDRMAYFADERCEEPESAVSERYKVDFPNKNMASLDAEDSIETIRTHRTVAPLGSQLAVYAKWFHHQADGSSLDAEYVDAIHSFADSRNIE
ncbi:hypothetical protein M199_gp255 [Halogranum tailed virus 1]|uniref:Uncharacterized protein n=1 Tax=Halogranum tailed virus 1 TaxID=1273749 RepID=R4TGQ0_9CAUD|nr:hypothetical protein M199_gp255 [Halogranum tailed virus 1]AGM11411.1 hypothetical protein HGTV1_113 [Halogranum tailed virus 1]